MRVAVTADPYLPIPPEHYGGIERVVDFLVRGLIARGHEVTLFAHPESRVACELHGYGAPPHHGPVRRAKELWQVGASLYGLRRRVDLVHSFGRLAALFPVLPVRSLPKIQTYQRDGLPRKSIRRALALSSGSLKFTACSTQMYARHRLAGDWTTVFNGVDLAKYDFAPAVDRSAPLVFVGRIEGIKGVHNAVAISKRSGRSLVIAGNVADQEYFDEVIRPELGRDGVEYVGPVDDAQKNALLGKACAFLMPIEWDEPFGIVMAEAMACGTPVIGFDRGSVPEVVRNRVTGFVCRGVDDAVDAVSSLDDVRRQDVRADVEKRFSSEVIVSAYVELYQEMVTAS